MMARLHAFDKLTFELPIAGGPYVIESYKAGKTMIFKRNPITGLIKAVRHSMSKVGFCFDAVNYKLYSGDCI